PLVNYLGLLMVVSGLGITLVAVWRRQPDALLLLLAFVMLWFTSLLRIGQVIGVLPAPWMMDYSQSWSMVLSGAVMATALANRMRMLRLENERSSMAVLVERQAAQQRLEAQVHQRTLELIEAKDKAEAASASKSTFLAHMSHELRTPLHSILGYSGLALNSETVLAADRRRIEAVQRSGRHLLTLIDELLDYARGEAGRLQLEPRPVYLRSLLESAVEDVLPLAQKAGADLHTAFDQVLPPVVLVDAGRLRQVLINLLGNASRHSRGTRISLDVRRVMVAPEDPARVMLWIGVRDNGIGIPEEARERIFSPFEQVEATATSAGIGLGLPIAAQLVQLMGGELVCECPPEGGCLFYFRIPLQLAPESELAPVRGPLGLRRYEGPVRRILVVDDIAENRALLADVLASLGFDLALAEDGLKALERLESEPFDAVIIDQFMPGLSGWQVLRRARERRLSLPFILLSATRAMPPADWPPGLLFVATLMKPVGPDRLAQVLGQVLGLRWSDDELEPTLPAMQALTTLAWPSAASLAELELALGMGQVTDIEEWVAATMEAQPEAEGFAQAVLEAVRRLDFPAIRRLLDLATAS
ncbi:MAG: ATP-binding protein, partial [Moraxellaceae bacterium]|nr:ATP-binding protein [Moraxellaceae bacterium]